MTQADTPQHPPPLLDRFKWVILLVVGAIVIGAFAYLLSSQDESVSITINPPAPTATHTSVPTQTPSPSPAPLEIYVTGAVNNPESRHTLPIGSRVEDAIAAAGGTTADADLSVVNLAQTLQDGDQIHVSSRLADQDPATPTPNTPRIINLNTATQADLETLPGVGPSRAADIIEYRDANNGFNSVDDLLEVSGIGEATLENLRTLVSVE